MSENEIERINYFCLLNLLTREGTNLFRKCVESNLPLNETIEHVLRNQRNTLEKLKRSKIINNAQMKLLYPINCSQAELDKVDMSLWFILARNITTSAFTNWHWKQPPRVCSGVRA